MLFNEPKTLIVVYKDELILNQLKKLIETNDDTSEDCAVGVTDGSVRIVAWTEKVWNDQKRAGNINNKVLFLGDVANSKNLLPVIDIKYNEYGIIYGWAGNQALIIADPKKMGSKDLYGAFISKLEEYSLPAQIKPVSNDNAQKDSTPKTDTEDKKGFAGFLGKAIKNTGNVFGTVSRGVKKAVSDIDSAIDDLPADRGLIAKQQLYYGTIKLYENHLEEYMKN